MPYLTQQRMLYLEITLLLVFANVPVLVDSLGIFTCDKYVVFCHRQRIFIKESSLPVAAAVVAAPIQNEWPHTLFHHTLQL